MIRGLETHKVMAKKYNITSSTLKSLERKLGQKNLAESLQVSPSTIRSWKKKKKIPQKHHKQLNAYRILSKNQRPSKKYKLRNKRYEKISKVTSIEYYEFTRTKNVAATVYFFDEVEPTLIQLSKLKLDGQSVDLFWITLNGLDHNEGFVTVSTPVFHIDEFLEIWRSEVNYLFADYSLNVLLSVTVTGKSFQF